MMILVDNITGTTMATQSEEFDYKKKEMAQKINSEVFCERFKSIYIGDFFPSVDAIESDTVDQINESLSGIKMSIIVTIRIIPYYNTGYDI